MRTQHRISPAIVEGARVSGLYAGSIPFSGTVTGLRFQPERNYEYAVRLDAPISVFGEMRDSILVSTCRSELSTMEAK